MTPLHPRRDRNAQDIQSDLQLPGGERGQRQPAGAAIRISLLQDRAGRPKARKGLRQTESMIGKAVRGALVIGLLGRQRKGVEAQGQFPLGRMVKSDRARRNGIISSFAQHPIHPHGGIEQIGPGLALKRNEFVEIENVIAEPRIDQIGEFDRSDRHFFDDVVAVLRRQLAAITGLVQARAGGVAGRIDQIGEFDDPTRPGLERFAVRPVHRAKADMFEGVARRVAGLGGGAKHLFKMLGLALIDDIQEKIGIQALPTIEDRRQIGGVIKRRAFGRQQDQRRDILFVGRLGNANDQRAGIALGQPARGKVVDHAGNDRIDVRFAFPQVKMHIEDCQFARQTGAGDSHKMSPQGAIAGPAGLQLSGGPPRGLTKLRIGFRLRAGERIKPLQILEGHRRLRGKRPIAVGKKGQIGLFGGKAGDQLAHLQAPIAHMDVAGDMIAAGTEQSLQAVADDRRAQMPDMHRLGDIRTAKIDDDPAGRWAREKAGLRVSGQRFHPRIERARSDNQVQEAGASDLDLRGADRIDRLIGRNDALGDLARRLPHRFGRRHAIITLKIGKVRTIRGADRAELTGDTGTRKGSAQALFQDHSKLDQRLVLVAQAKSLAVGIERQLFGRQFKADQDLKIGAGNFFIGARDNDPADLVAHRDHRRIAGKPNVDLKKLLSYYRDIASRHRDEIAISAPLFLRRWTASKAKINVQRHVDRIVIYITAKTVDLGDFAGKADIFKALIALDFDDARGRVERANRRARTDISLRRKSLTAACHQSRECERAKTLHTLVHHHQSTIFRGVCKRGSAHGDAAQPSLLRRNERARVMGYEKPSLIIKLAAPRGFCAGVERAILIVQRAIEKFGAPVYVRHEIVHNKRVVEKLVTIGAVFVEELDECPDDRPVVFSAHGVPKAVPAEAESRSMIYVDATCPLVSKVHVEAERHFENDREIILIGHAGHPEVVGTLGQLPDGAITLIETVEDAERYQPRDPEKLAYITQTTLSVDDTAEMIGVLQRRFPSLSAPHKEDICYATTNRQEAVKALAKDCDLIIVLGSSNSSNSVRLVEVALRAGARNAVLLDKAADLDWSLMEGVRVLGITAGASAPEELVEELMDALNERFILREEEVVVTREDVVFKLPRVLQEA